MNVLNFDAPGRLAIIGRATAMMEFAFEGYTHPNNRDGIKIRCA
jgi:hypothetical protein